MRSDAGRGLSSDIRYLHLIIERSLDCHVHVCGQIGSHICISLGMMLVYDRARLVDETQFLSDRYKKDWCVPKTRKINKLDNIPRNVKRSSGNTRV